MPSVTVFRFSFTSSWKMLSLTVLGVSLCIALGIWQLHRATEKRSLLAQYHKQSQLSAVALEPNRPVPPYQKIQVQGRFLGKPARHPISPRHPERREGSPDFQNMSRNTRHDVGPVFLLDNQHHEHRFGYDVIRPFVLSDGTVVLIDQGWVPGDVSRQSLPHIPAMRMQTDITGQAYYPPRHPFLLGKGIEVKTHDKVVIEALDIQMIEQFLHKSLYPFIIRQSIDQSSDFVRDWPIVAGSPMRHIGYAVQWFLFAMIMAGMYFILHIKRKV